MRKYFTLFIAIAGSLVLSFGLTSCEGPAGPPGPPGFDGVDGVDGADGLIGSIFEAQIDFDKADDYQAIVDFPASIDVFDSDVVVAYVLTAVDNGTDIWEPLPQTLFFDTDILLYGYDHTSFDIRFFLDGTIDLGTLDPVFTDGVIFRVAIIPADFAAALDVNKFEDVMSALKVENVKRIN
jgi:hypothetical protein